MRIAQLTRQFTPCLGGIESVVLRLAEKLSAHGHDVTVITLDRCFDRVTDELPHHEAIGDIKVQRVPYWGSRRYAIAPGVLKCLRGCDIAHIHSADFFLDYLALTKSVHSTPLVLSTHGMFFHTNFARSVKELYLRTFTTLSLRAVDRVLCDSEHDYEILSHVAPARKLHLQPNGIEYERYADLQVKGRDFLELVSVGRLASNKRYDRMLRAFALLRDHVPEVRLTIIGPDWGERDLLERMIVDLDLGNSVRLPGRVSDEEMKSYLARATFWLTSSEYESFGVALLEAMAAACIPIVQPLTAFSQLVTDEQNGFYVDFEEPDTAASQIARIVNLPESERYTIAGCARQTAERFSWTSVTQDILRIYHEVCR